MAKCSSFWAYAERRPGEWVCDLCFPNGNTYVMNSPEEKIILLIGLSKNCLACTLKERNSNYTDIQFSLVQFSHSVVSDSLRPHESQHARPPCPSPTPGLYSNSCPSSQWCHPAISFSVISFSSCPHSLQHQGLFPWVNSSNEVAKVLEFQLQHQSFQWTPRTDLL